MNTTFTRPEIGQWYAHTDKGELFRVVGRDDEAHTIEIQLADGDVDEMDSETWATLPLEAVEPPEDWTAPMDDVETDDLGYSETDMSPADWEELLQPLHAQGESWEETQPEEERDALGEGVPEEPFVVELPEAEDYVR